MTKEDLIILSIPYFENNDIPCIYATTDGNFFYEHDKLYAEVHAGSIDGVKVVKIDREETVIEDEEEEEYPTNKEIKEFLSEKGIEFRSNTRRTELITLYKENK